MGHFVWSWIVRTMPWFGWASERRHLIGIWECIVLLYGVLLHRSFRGVDLSAWGSHVGLRRHLAEHDWCGQALMYTEPPTSLVTSSKFFKLGPSIEAMRYSSPLLEYPDQPGSGTAKPVRLGGC